MPARSIETDSSSVVPEPSSEGQRGAAREPRRPVQGAELWVPKGDVLVLEAGAYGPHAEFARVSGRSRFRRGEGLPGAVWATERAVLWEGLETHFVRAEYARAAGMDSAIGLPWFRGNELAGVITLLLSAWSDTPACLEIWNHDDTIEVLKHGGGLYVNAPEFERVSALLQFPYAAGLPGLAWSTGLPVLMDDVRASNEFVRAKSAALAGLKSAVAVPIFRQRRVTHVLTMLGAESAPFVRAFELFVQAEVGLVGKIRLEQTASGLVRAPPGQIRGARHALAMEARSTGMPVIARPPESPPHADAREGRSEISLVLPIHDGARLRGVAYFEL